MERLENIHPNSHLGRAIRDYDEHFLARWRHALDEFRASEGEDRMWLVGPTSYLFSIAGQKLAVDPQIRRASDFDALLPHLVQDFSPVSAVLITHQHDDHMCLPLMRALKDTPIRWYLPFGCRLDLVERSEIKPENIVWVRDGDEFSFGALTVRAFDTPHVPAGEDMASFPERGYELITGRGRVLMPADVRNYDYDGYPDFGAVTLCLAHLWAGNDAIHEENYLPLLEKFAEFLARFRAETYFLCHLYEIGRKELFLWHDGHAEIAAHKLLSHLPQSRVTLPRIGESYALFEKKGGA